MLAGSHQQSKLWELGQQGAGEGRPLSHTHDHLEFLEAGYQLFFVGQMVLENRDLGCLRKLGPVGHFASYTRIIVQHCYFHLNSTSSGS